MEQVEWAKLDYAYGESTNVSDLIQTILSGEETEACEACATLHNKLVHQGSVYSSTYEAIPFLIGTLSATGNAPCARVGVLWLLDDIVSSCAFWVNAPEFDRAEVGWPSPKEFIERAWLGSALFCRLLDEDSSADIRMLAARLLGMLVTPGPRIAGAEQSDRYASAAAALTDRVRADETDDLALSSVVFALGRAAAHDRSLIRYLRETRVRLGVGEQTRVAAALAVVEIEEGKHATLEEVDLLVDAMCRAPETDTLFQLRTGPGSERRSPWVMARLRFKLRAALCAWSAGDEPRMERVLPALLAGVRLATAYTADVDLGPVFLWLWPDRRTRSESGAHGRLHRVTPPPVVPSDLIGVARRVVQACYDNPAIWDRPVGNTILAFRDAELPETRCGLGELLDRPA
jgi:hypothetical protein